MPPGDVSLGVSESAAAFRVLAVDEPSASDTFLAERARAGDRTSFEAIYRRHAGRVFAICLRMTADGSRAEDLTQEVFVRAWQGLRELRAEAGLGAWLRRVTVNAVLDDRRARGRRSWREEDLLSDVAMPSRDHAAGLDLEAAIARLPEGARAVLVLHDIEGHTHVEIGDSLGIDATTSRTQLHRARRLLREVLKR